MKIAVGSEIYFVVLRGCWEQTPQNIESIIIQQQMWGTQLEQNHTEVMVGMFACNFSHYLFCCNSEGKLTPSNSCPNRQCKMSLRGSGEPQQPDPLSGITSTAHSNWQALLPVQTQQNKALGSELYFHAGFGSSQNSLGKCCSNSTQSCMMPLLLWQLFYVPKNVLCFVGIGMVLSTGTVILFCYFPDRTGPVSFLFHLFGGAGRKCLWLGSAEQPGRFLFTETADSSGKSFQAGFDLAKLLQKWTGPSVLVWSSC